TSSRLLVSLRMSFGVRPQTLYEDVVGPHNRTVMIDVMQELRPIGDKYKSGDLRSGLLLLHDLWSRLPEPKAAVLNAYLIVEYGVAFALKLHDLNEAWLWVGQAPDFKEKRHDMGKVEFLIGKVAYEAGKLDMATEQFREAHRKSEGRIFSGKDPKYSALLKQ